METIKLTPEQKAKWSDTMSLMAWTAPGFRHLWYKLLSNNSGEYLAVPARDVPVAATDGKNVMINPDTFFEYNLKQRVFIGAHEVIHNVYDDCGTLHRLKGQSTITCNDGTVFPYKHEVMQKAMDLRINALLVESKIGEMPPDALYDPEIARGKDGLFDIYGKVYKNDEGQGQGQGQGSGGQGQGQGSGGQGQGQGDPKPDPTGNDVLPPGSSTGQSPSTAQSQRNPSQWAMELAVAQALEATVKTQGRGVGLLNKMFQEILQPKVPWTDHIEAIIHRRTGSGSYDYRRPDRRFIVRDCYIPGRSGFGAGWLVIWGDTSGSRSDREIEQSLGEIAGIVEQTRPRRLTVIWGDAAVHDVDEVYDEADIQTIVARGVRGRGGTDVTPVFDWIEEQRELPDMFIGFTDGGLSFPQEPGYPVVWASSTDATYPYGEVVRVD